MAPPREVPHPQQVAERLGYGAEQIRVLCRIGPKLGGLRAVKGKGRNGHYRIPESAITEWAHRNAYDPGAR